MITKLPLDMRRWTEMFIDGPHCRNWADTIAGGAWDDFSEYKGERWAVDLVQEMFIAAQEVLEEDNG